MIIHSTACRWSVPVNGSSSIAAILYCSTDQVASSGEWVTCPVIIHSTACRWSVLAAILYCSIYQWSVLANRSSSIEAIYTAALTSGQFWRIGHHPLKRFYTAALTSGQFWRIGHHPLRRFYTAALTSGQFWRMGHSPVAISSLRWMCQRPGTPQKRVRANGQFW